MEDAQWWTILPVWKSLRGRRGFTGRNTRWALPVGHRRHLGFAFFFVDSVASLACITSVKPFRSVQSVPSPA